VVWRHLAMTSSAVDAPIYACTRVESAFGGKHETSLRQTRNRRHGAGVSKRRVDYRLTARIARDFRVGPCWQASWRSSVQWWSPVGSGRQVEAVQPAAEVPVEPAVGDGDGERRATWCCRSAGARAAGPGLGGGDRRRTARRVPRRAVKGRGRLLENFSCRGCTRRPMGHPPGPTTCTAVRGVPPLHEKGVSPQRTTKR
jgi:hypothetical protein